MILLMATINYKQNAGFIFCQVYSNKREDKILNSKTERQPLIKRLNGPKAMASASATH